MKGKKLPVYRASLPRTLTAVVALLLTPAATRGFAREFRAADTQSEDYPTVRALAMPFLFRSIGHQRKVLDGPIGTEIPGSFERHGFVGLTFRDSGARSIYHNVRPVRTPADMKGLRIRVRQSELMSDMIKALGAGPIELPYGQVLTGLSTRLVDGAENNWPSFITTGHYKFSRFHTLTGHTMSPEVLVMPLKARQSLSPDDQNIFREAALNSSQFMREK